VCLANTGGSDDRSQRTDAISQVSSDTLERGDRELLLGQRDVLAGRGRLSVEQVGKPHRWESGRTMNDTGHWSLAGMPSRLGIRRR
jgi:hypothetical protein